MQTTAELKKQIIIGLTGDEPVQCGLHIDADITATEALQLLGTLASHILKSYYQIAANQICQPPQMPDDTQAAALLGIKQSMYDAFDNLISNVLNDFYPEYPRLEIEDEAILELTNRKIEERYSELSEEEKAAYQATYHSLISKFTETKPNDNN